MKVSARFAGGMIAVIVAIALHVVPAHATVHEIVAQWCSGQEPLEPHGLSRPGSKNFARPLAATGVLQMTFDPDLGVVVVSFDEEHPAAKVVNSGILVPIGSTPDGTEIFLNLPVPNPSFPAFQRCPRLAS